MPQPNTIRLAGQVFPLGADGHPVIPPLAGGETTTTTLAEDRASRLRASAATGQAFIARSARTLADFCSTRGPPSAGSRAGRT